VVHHKKLKHNSCHIKKEVKTDVAILVVRRNSGCSMRPRRFGTLPVDIAFDRRAYSGVTTELHKISNIDPFTAFVFKRLAVQ